eukprot:GHVU01177476.1.p1 GENE.GHVU01177476.1~~GHVU01177476.1.p1  ORF type:complete len:163 (+),score=19.87 GHVU01177476.1:616-1104(+)
MTAVDFENFCDPHRGRMQDQLGPADAASFFASAAEAQQRLVALVGADDVLASSLRNLRRNCDVLSFGDLWKPLAGHGFCGTSLFQLCAGLACVYPTSAEVERDFCLLRYVLSAYRQATSFLLLEGFYQSKQFRQLYLAKGHLLTEVAATQECEDGLTDGEQT